MWASFALVLLCGLAVTAQDATFSQTTPIKPELPAMLFSPNTKYTYNYTVEALTSIPHESKTVTGLRISCALDISIEPNEETSRSDLFRLRNCDVSVVNGDLASKYREHAKSMPFIMLPKEAFESVDSIVAVGETIKTHLHKPVSFEYVLGSICEIKTSEDDPIWSVNIKKGALSILKAFTTTRREINSVADESRIRESDKARSDRDDYLVYHAIEQDAIGTCESVYAWDSQPSPYSMPVGSGGSRWLQESASVLRVMNLTKIRNYANCSSDPFVVQTTMPIDETPLLAEPGKAVLNSSAHIDYSIVVISESAESSPSSAGSNSYGSQFEGKPIVERVFARTQHVFAPFGVEYGYMAAVTYQTLELLSFSRDVESTPLSLSLSPSLFTKATTIEMKQAEFSDLTAETSGEDLAVVRNKIQSLITDLRHSYESERRENIGSLLISLVDELKKLDLNGLKAVFEMTKQMHGARNVPSSVVPEERLRHFFIDLLPTVGTRHAVRMMKELLKDAKSAKRVVSRISYLNFLMPPHPTVLPEVAKLCDEPEMKVEKGECSKAAKLAYGSLVHNLFADWKSTPSFRLPRCTVIAGSHAECGKAFTESAVVLKRWLRDSLQSKKENETVAALEAMENSGHPSCVSEIKKILEESSASLTVKVAAGYALRKTAAFSHKKKEIRSILLPIMRDSSIDVELRIMAYTVLLETGIKEPFVEHIAHLLAYDRSTYFVNYVYNHLKSLAQSDIPNLKDIASQIKIMLAGISKPKSEYYPFGRRVHFPFYSKEMQLGASLNLASLSAPSSFLPRSVELQLNAYIFGKRVNLLEVISRVEGLQPLLDQLMGPGRSKWSSALTYLDKESKVRRGEPVEERHELEGESEAVTKNPTIPRPRPFLAHCMVKVFGKHVSFSFVNSDSIMRVLFGSRDKLGRTTADPIDFSNIEQTLSNGIETSLRNNFILIARARVPTLAGIPLYLNSTAGVQMNADKFKLAAGFEPALFSEHSGEDERRENEEERHGPRSDRVSEAESRDSGDNESEGTRRSGDDEGESEGRSESAKLRCATCAAKVKKLEKFFAKWQEETLKRKITLRVEGNPKVYAMAHFSLGFDLQELATLTGVNFDLKSDFTKESLGLEVDLDIKNGALIASIDLPKMRHVALNASATPFGLITVPLGSSASRGKHVVHTAHVENELVNTYNKSAFRYYRRSEEFNATAYMSKTPCADGRSFWKTLPTHAFCGKQAFEVVLHGRRSSEKIQLITRLGTNVTLSMDGKTYRYPPSSSRTLISTSDTASHSTRSWSLSASSLIETASSRSGPRPLMSLKSVLNIRKVLKLGSFDMGVQFEHDLTNECVDSECSSRRSSSSSSSSSSASSSAASSMLTGRRVSAVSLSGKYVVPSIDQLPSYAIKKKPSPYTIDNQLGLNFTVCIGTFECDRSEETAKRINVVLGFKKSEKQKLLESLWWTYVNKPINHENMTLEMLSCKEDLIKGYSHSDACYKLWLSFANFNKMDLQIDWSKFSTDLNSRVMLSATGTSVMHYIRKAFFDKWSSYYDYEYVRPDSVSPDVCRVSMERDPETKFIDAEIRHEHSRYELIPGYVDKFSKLKPSWPVCVPNAYLPFWESCAMEMLKNDPSLCFHNHDYVSSFDGKHFYEPMLGEPEREFIVSKDASDKKRFEVTSKNIDDSHKRVNLTLPDFVVSIVPITSSEGRRSDVKVLLFNKVTGESRELDVTKGDYLTVDDGKGKLVLMFTRYWSSRVSVYAVRDGVTVHSDGYSVEVRVSPFYYNSVRGICGSYNAEKWDDFTGVAGELYAEPRPFVAAYSIHPLESTPEYNSGVRRGCIEKVSITEKREETRELLCIGKSTITECETTCPHKKIAHICIDKASEIHTEIIREYGSDESLNELPVHKLPEVIRKLSDIDSAVRKTVRIDVNSC